MAQQRHVVDDTALRQAIADQAVTDQQNRDAVIGVLQQSHVRELAGRLGLNVTRAENAVSTLDSVELASLAESARMADVQLAGGANTIVISTTTLLLILIIVILVAS
jgi:predicted xylose isomerase-like sugar epimerase